MYAVVYIPDFFLQAALRPTPELHDQPVALVEGSTAKPFVLQFTAAAEAAGVTKGMSPTQALARCGGLVLKTRSAAQELSAATALVDCSYAFSPYVEATTDGVCTIDLQGNPLLATLTKDGSDAGALHAWAGKILSRLLELNLAAQIGIAATPIMALHAARVARPILIVAKPEEFLGELPIEALEPSGEISAILRKWGIESVGAFVRLGKARLAERLGPEALTLFDRATGAQARPLRLVNPPERFTEAIDFDHQIETTQPLLFVLQRFLEQLSLRLEIVYLVAEQIDLRLIFSHGPDYERSFRVPSPTRKVQAWFRILDTHLESLRTDHPIVGLRVGVVPSRPAHQQFSLFEPALRDPNQFYETLARLTGLVGSDRVGIPKVMDTYRADTVGVKPVDFEAVASASGKRMFAKPTPARGCRGLRLRRFRPPLVAEVELTDNRPAAVKTELFRHVIRNAEGPWRTSGEWWDNQPWAREEWDIETGEGELYRLARTQGQWSVEAVYD